jgi:hypothetical protein
MAQPVSKKTDTNGYRLPDLSIDGATDKVARSFDQNRNAVQEASPQTVPLETSRISPASLPPVIHFTVPLAAKPTSASSGLPDLSDMAAAFKTVQTAETCLVNGQHAQAFGLLTLAIAQIGDSKSSNRRTLLLKSICHLKICQTFRQENKEGPLFFMSRGYASESLESLYEQTIMRPSPENNDPSFWHQLGRSFFLLSSFSNNDSDLTKSIVCFRKELRLQENSPKSQSYQTYFAQGVACLTLFRKQLYSLKEKIESHSLKQAIDCFKQADSLQKSAGLTYLLALCHAAYSQLRNDTEEHLLHLNRAVQLLEHPGQRPAALTALLGICRYRLAFDYCPEKKLNVDFGIGCQAESDLKSAFMARADDTDGTLLLCLSDCERQLSWLTAARLFDTDAETHLKKMASQQPKNFIAAASLRIFYIQRYLQTKQFEPLLDELSQLKVLMRPRHLNIQTDCHQIYMMADLIKALRFIEDNWGRLSAARPKQYNELIDKIGEELNRITVISIFISAMNSMLIRYELNLPIDAGQLKEGV